MFIETYSNTKRGTQKEEIKAQVFIHPSDQKYDLNYIMLSDRKGSGEDWEKVLPTPKISIRSGGKYFDFNSFDELIETIEKVKEGRSW